MMTTATSTPAAQRAAMRSAVPDVLRRAHELVAGGWTQGQEAVDADGRLAFGEGPDACAWCLTGAIDRAAFEILGGNPDQVDDSPDFTARWIALREAAGERVWSLLAGQPPEAFNDADDTTQADVLELLDRAALPKALRQEAGS